MDTFWRGGGSPPALCPWNTISLKSQRWKRLPSPGQTEEARGGVVKPGSPPLSSPLQGSLLLSLLATWVRNDLPSITDPGPTRVLTHLGGHPGFESQNSRTRGLSQPPLTSARWFSRFCELGDSRLLTPIRLVPWGCSWHPPPGLPGLAPGKLTAPGHRSRAYQPALPTRLTPSTGHS